MLFKKDGFCWTSYIVGRDDRQAFEHKMSSLDSKSSSNIFLNNIIGPVKVITKTTLLLCIFLDDRDYYNRITVLFKRYDFFQKGFILAYYCSKGVLPLTSRETEFNKHGTLKTCYY